MLLFFNNFFLTKKKKMVAMNEHHIETIHRVTATKHVGFFPAGLLLH